MDQDRGTTADRGAGTAGRAADPTTTSDHGTAPDHGRTPGRGTAPSSGIGDPSTLGVEDVLRLLGTSHSGLTPEDAAARLATAGPNAITTHGRTPALVKWLAQFKDWLVLLLLACALVVGWLGDLSTAAVLLVLVLINTTIGFVQEYRAERTMEALSALVHPTAQVVRGGRPAVVDSSSLVPGDLVRLSGGDSVPADLRLVSTQSLEANEFALTGESDPTRKSTTTLEHAGPLPDRHDMVFAGTVIGAGEGLGVVTATGMRTQLGHIARMSDEAPTTPSPMQREMATIARVVGIAVVVLSLLLLVFAVHQDMPLRRAVLFAVGLACALVPQGLPAEVSTSLAQASALLARHHALVKKLSAVETLGATQVICTDKTGTLTQNQMTVVRALVGSRQLDVTGTGYAPRGTVVDHASGTALVPDASTTLFLSTGVLASTARLLPPDATHPDWYVIGDPTEGALLPLAAKGGVDPDATDHAQPVVRELPFDSTRKRMTSIRRCDTALPVPTAAAATGPDAAPTAAADPAATAAATTPDTSGTRCIAYTKGSPETVLAVSTRILDGDRVRPLTDEDRQAFLATDRRLASTALRNLALAVREVDEGEARDEHAGTGVIERDLVLLGLVSMRDPLREEVPAAMARTREAGIRVDIVTGDSATTAAAIARQAGLCDPGTDPRVVTGEQLSAMPDGDVLRTALGGGVIFSRVAPEDKMRIVSLVRASGSVVAVTGDGINDAPALRHADIGVAMGRTGTDVAKDAAEVVLLDDSFATLVDAVGQGRTIYTNISRGVLSCLTSNIAEFVVNIASLALTIVMGLPLALNVLQILAIDVLGEIIPISALGADRAEGENMRRPPRDPRARILGGRSLGDVLATGGVMGALAVGGFLLAFPLQGVAIGEGDARQAAAATTVTYATILMSQLVNIIHRRSVHGIFSRHQLTNRRFWIACLLAVAIMGVIVYVPLVAGFFGTAPLTPSLWLPVLGAMVVMAGARWVIARFLPERS